MSTITKEFTKEQLIEKLQHRISVASGFPESEKAQMDLELARIALASLEAEAVGEVIEQQSGMMMDGLVISEKPTYRNIKGIHKMKMMPLGTKFYTAPPAPANAEPVAWLWSHRKHPSEVTLVRPEDDERAEGAHWSGWSCQALYAEPVTTDYKLRDAVDAIRNSGIAIDGEKILAERDALNSPVIPGGWKLVPIELTPRMITKLQQNTEIGSYIAANWAGAYDLFQKFWDEAIAAAPQQEGE